MKSYMMHEYGGSEVLQLIDYKLDAPNANQVRIRQTYVGLNFIDIYFRTGFYKPAALPFVPGVEGAGVVVELGTDVTHFKIGDRVAYASQIGGFSEERLINADRLVKLPDTISDEHAAAMMLKGLTAHYLLRLSYRIEKGSKILFHAAAGGVGLIAGQWANALGAEVIGTVRGEEKAELAKANGYHHVIDYEREDWVSRVKEITDGRGVDVAYDSIGKDTYPHSLDCIKPRGMWVSFGQSSGGLPPINFGIFAQKGSLYATRPVLNSFIATEAELDANAAELFSMVQSGKINIHINQTRPFSELREAQDDLTNRRTTGCTILKI